jgi:hypothetical protein
MPSIMALPEPPPKASLALQEYLEGKADTDEVTAYIFTRGIDQEALEDAVYDKIKINMDSFEIEQKGIAYDPLVSLGRLLDAEFPPEGTNLYSWERLEVDEHFELEEKVNSYIETKRDIASGKNKTHLNGFANAHLTAANIIFQSELAPMFIYKTTKAGVAELEKLNQVVYMDLYLDLELNDANSSITIHNIDGIFTRDTVGLQGKGVKIGMIEAFVPRDNVSVINYDKLNRLTRNPSFASHHATQVLAIMAGTEGVAPEAEVVAAGIQNRLSDTDEDFIQRMYTFVEQLIRSNVNVILFRN